MPRSPWIIPTLSAVTVSLGGCAGWPGDDIEGDWTVTRMNGYNLPAEACYGYAYGNLCVELEAEMSLLQARSELIGDFKLSIRYTYAGYSYRYQYNYDVDGAILKRNKTYEIDLDGDDSFSLDCALSASRDELSCDGDWDLELERD